MTPMKRFFLLLALFVAVAIAPAYSRKPIKALIVSGQNNHNWQVSHLVLQQILNNSGLTEADIALTAPAGGDMSSFAPDFSKYDVVVLDYNGDRWPAKTDEAFLEFVRQGGGVVIYHAADNAFIRFPDMGRHHTRHHDLIRHALSVYSSALPVGRLLRRVLKRIALHGKAFAPDQRRDRPADSYGGRPFDRLPLHVFGQ